MKNINTKSYWDNRFSTGDWEQKSGRNQTKQFAISQIPLLEIPKSFSGTILDFGCGLGDAFPIYKDAFPNAKIIGLDLSNEAIIKCKENYSHLGEFICGDYTDVPKVDVIIASNVFEHLTDNRKIAKYLLQKCNQLNIIVPYKETLGPIDEHINSYDENYFHSIGKYYFKKFSSKGWGSDYGMLKYYHVNFKNLLKPFFGKPIVIPAKQIIFIFNQ